MYLILILEILAFVVICLVVYLNWELARVNRVLVEREEGRNVLAVTLESGGADEWVELGVTIEGGAIRGNQFTIYRSIQDSLRLEKAHITSHALQLRADDGTPVAIAEGTPLTAGFDWWILEREAVRREKLEDLAPDRTSDGESYARARYGFAVPAGSRFLILDAAAPTSNSSAYRQAPFTLPTKPDGYEITRRRKIRRLGDQRWIAAGWTFLSSSGILIAFLAGVSPLVDAIARSAGGLSVLLAAVVLVPSIYAIFVLRSDIGLVNYLLGRIRANER